MKRVKITTTFKRLHDNDACIGRYRYLAKALGGIVKYGRITPINLLQILKHNGLDDFFWALGIVGENRIFRFMAAGFAEAILPIFERQWPNDSRPRETIEVARRYANGDATEGERAVARTTSLIAARAIAVRDVAEALARDVALAAAGAAARDVTGALVRDIALVTIGAVDKSAAKDMDRATEEKKQIAIIKRYLI